MLHAHTTTTRLFTDRVWDRTESLRGAIDDLEFLRLLGEGTLPLEVFRTYIEQDSLYLTGYSKALALLAAKSPDPQTAAFWASSSANAAAVESAMHEQLLTGGVLPPRQGTPEHSQTCLAYVSYLIAAAATESYAVAAAAALPCFWIYAEVGRDLAERAAQVIAADPAHPYAQWVTTYGAAEFQQAAATARVLVDAAAAAASEPELAAMEQAFVLAVRYELMFWDTALHPQPWPAA
ncbi:TenA family protein [Nocardia sp. NPDC059177]|uniref:TenA family protein n=1 Tax=Nocardia sp. NPDC059177 TaxID=3346759 RepID=UPI0036958BB6